MVKFSSLQLPELVRAYIGNTKQHKKQVLQLPIFMPKMLLQPLAKTLTALHASRALVSAKKKQMLRDLDPGPANTLSRARARPP